VISRDEADALLEALLGDQQTRLGGEHVDHARRVAADVGSTDGDSAYVAALLHDTVEMGAIDHRELAEHVDDPDTMRLIDLLTHREGETMDDYLRRCAVDPVAERIKRADLTDKLGPQDVEVEAGHAATLAAEARDRLARLTAYAAEAEAESAKRQRTGDSR
jgi:(p)ppGpp synthase/HD superfamily hydrolase